MKLGQAFKNYYKTIIWVLLMLYMLFSPANALPKSGIFKIPHFDKLVHFGMFFILIFLFRLETDKNFRGKILFRNIFIWVVILFAALSEVIQNIFIEGRSGNVYDFIADLTGFFTGTVFYLWLWRRMF